VQGGKVLKRLSRFAPQKLKALDSNRQSLNSLDEVNSVSGKRHPKGYLRELVERAKVDPEGVCRELEAKGDLSQTEFAILEALRSSEKGRPCKRCGKPFIPNTSHQVFCSKSCRVVYYVNRYKKRNK
jgi:hypothetical protein